MDGKPARVFGVNSIETKLLQIKLIDEDVNHSDGIILGDVVVHAFGK
jgi:hypothetical protein